MIDEELVTRVIDRDWRDFEAACRRLGVGIPTIAGQRISIPCIPAASADQYLAIVECVDYDAQAPLLQFADPAGSGDIGRQWWPRMATAPINNIVLDGAHTPILCVPGTLGYHLHPSHCNEQHPRTAWRLPVVAAILHRFLHQWGPYQGRGL